MASQEEAARTAWKWRPSPWFVSVAVGLFLVWTVALGFAGWWVWIRGIQQENATLSFLSSCSPLRGIGWTCESHSRPTVLHSPRMGTRGH